jgi:hypothetical protein
VARSITANVAIYANVIACTLAELVDFVDYSDVKHFREGEKAA